MILNCENLNYLIPVPVPSLLQKHLCQTLSGGQDNALSHLLRHAHEWRVRAVHGVRDIATWELSRHRLLSSEGYGLILLGEEKADLDTVAPRFVRVVVREDAGRFGLERGDSLLDKSLVRHISVKDLTCVDRRDEVALHYYFKVSSSGVSREKGIQLLEALTVESGCIHGR